MRVTGFEPATIRLKAEGSTVELHPRIYLFLKDLVVHDFKLRRSNDAHPKHVNNSWSTIYLYENI